MNLFAGIAPGAEPDRWKSNSQYERFQNGTNGLALLPLSVNGAGFPVPKCTIACPRRLSPAVSAPLSFAMSASLSAMPREERNDRMFVQRVQ